MNSIKKSKIFKICLLTSVIFTNFSFLNNLDKKSNFHVQRENFDFLTSNATTQSNIKKSKTDFAWLEKYKNDKDFTNCDFNACISGSLIEKVLVDHYLTQAKIAFFHNFKEYVLSYNGNLKFTYEYYHFSNDYDDVIGAVAKLPEFKTIKFDLNYFNQCVNEFDFNTIFDCKGFNFILQNEFENDFCNDVVSCFLISDIKGIYYIDESDKKNADNEVNKIVKSKIKQLKMQMDYTKKQFFAFKNSLKQSRFCLMGDYDKQKEIYELISYLSQLVNDMKKLFNHVAVKKEIYKTYRETTNEDNIRKDFDVWIDNYDIRHSLAYEDLYWFLLNEDAFFSYLTFYKDKYSDGENINFKKAIADFLLTTKLNYTITSFEKAVASYIIAVWGNKAIISSTSWTCENWEKWIFENWNTIVEGITIVVGGLAFFYYSSFIPAPLWWSTEIPNAINFVRGPTYDISPLNIIQPPNDLSSLNFGNFFSPTDSLDHSPFSHFIEKTLQESIVNEIVNETLKNVNKIKSAIKFGKVFNNFLKFISTKKYHDINVIKPLSPSQIFEMIEQTFDDEKNQTLSSHKKVGNVKESNENIIGKENDNEVENIVYEIIEDLFENQYPKEVELYPNNKCLFKAKCLPQKIVSWYPIGTIKIHSDSLIPKIYSKFNKHPKVNGKYEINDDTVSRCLFDYINVPKIDIENTDMEDIFRIPLSYGPDKGIFDGIKFSNYLYKGKSFYNRFQEAYKKNDIEKVKTKIMKILGKQNHPILYYFNSNFWIPSSSINKNFSSKIPINYTGEGYIPFIWVLLPILKILKKDQNQFTIDELIEIVTSLFKIENIDEKINFDHVKQIFGDNTLITRIENGETLYLKDSLPKSIKDDLSNNIINDDPIIIDGQEYVKLSLIVSSIESILKQKNNDLSYLPTILLQNIVKFYFKKIMQKSRKQFDDKDLHDFIIQQIEKIFKNGSIFCIDTSDELWFVPVLLPEKIQAKLPIVFNENIPELIDLNQIAQATMEVLKTSNDFSNIIVNWDDSKLKSFILDHLKKIVKKFDIENLPRDLKIDLDNFDEVKNKRISVVKKLIERFIMLSKDIRIQGGYDSFSKKYIFYTTTTYLSPLILKRMTIKNKEIIKKGIAIPFDSVLKVIIDILKEDKEFLGLLSPNELEVIIESFYYKWLKRIICKIDNINDININIDNKNDKRQLENYISNRVKLLLNNAKFLINIKGMSELNPNSNPNGDCYFFSKTLTKAIRKKLQANKKLAELVNYQDVATSILQILSSETRSIKEKHFDFIREKVLNLILSADNKGWDTIMVVEKIGITDYIRSVIERICVFKPLNGYENKTRDFVSIRFKLALLPEKIQAKFISLDKDKQNDYTESQVFDVILQILKENEQIRDSGISDEDILGIIKQYFKEGHHIEIHNEENDEENNHEININYISEFIDKICEGTRIIGYKKQIFGKDLVFFKLTSLPKKIRNKLIFVEGELEEYEIHLLVNIIFVMLSEKIKISDKSAKKIREIIEECIKEKARLEHIEEKNEKEEEKDAIENKEDNDHIDIFIKENDKKKDKKDNHEDIINYIRDTIGKICENNPLNGNEIKTQDLVSIEFKLTSLPKKIQEKLNPLNKNKKNNYTESEVFNAILQILKKDEKIGGSDISDVNILEIIEDYFYFEGKKRIKIYNKEVKDEKEKNINNENDNNNIINRENKNKPIEVEKVNQEIVNQIKNTIERIFANKLPLVIDHIEKLDPSHSIDYIEIKTLPKILQKEEEKNERYFYDTKNNILKNVLKILKKDVKIKLSGLTKIEIWNIINDYFDEKNHTTYEKKNKKMLLHTNQDYLRAGQMFVKSKHRGLKLEYNDCLNVVAKERELEEQIKQQRTTTTYNLLLPNLIKDNLGNSIIVKVIDDIVYFKYNSLPEIFKEGIIPSSISLNQLINTIKEIIDEKNKCDVKRSLVEYCLKKILNLKSSHFQGKQCDLVAINRDIKSRNEQKDVNYLNDEFANDLFSVDFFRKNKKNENDDNKINNDKDFFEEEINTNSLKEKNDKNLINKDNLVDIIIETIRKIFDGTTPIVTYCKEFPFYRRYYEKNNIKEKNINNENDNNNNISNVRENKNKPIEVEKVNQEIVNQIKNTNETNIIINNIDANSNDNINAKNEIITEIKNINIRKKYHYDKDLPAPQFYQSIIQKSSDEKVYDSSYFIPYFAFKSLPKKIQKQINKKELVSSSVVAEKIMEIIENHNSKKCFSIKEFNQQPKSQKFLLIHEQLNILYNPKFKLDSKIAPQIIEYLNGIRAMKKTDITKMETLYLVEVKSLRGFKKNKTIIQQAKDGYVKFDVLIDEIIKTLYDEKIISYEIKENYDFEPEYYNSKQYINFFDEKICISKQSEVSDQNPEKMFVLKVSQTEKNNYVIEKKIKDFCYHWLWKAEKKYTFKKDKDNVEFPLESVGHKNELNVYQEFYSYFPIDLTDIWKNYLENNKKNNFFDDLEKKEENINNNNIINVINENIINDDENNIINDNNLDNENIINDFKFKRNKRINRNNEGEEINNNILELPPLKYDLDLEIEMPVLLPDIDELVGLGIDEALKNGIITKEKREINENLEIKIFPKKHECFVFNKEVIIWSGSEHALKLFLSQDKNKKLFKEIKKAIKWKKDHQDDVIDFNQWCFF